MNVITVSDADEHLILEALNMLIVSKRAAFVGLSQAAPQLVSGPHPLTQRDFGIPQILDLMERIGGPV